MAFLDQLNPQLSLADLLSGGGGGAPPFRPLGFNPGGMGGTSSGGIVPPPGMLPPTYQGGGMGGGFNDQRLGGILPPTPAPGSPPFRPPDFNPTSGGIGTTGGGVSGPGGGIGTGGTVQQPQIGAAPRIGTSAPLGGGTEGLPPAPKPMTMPPPTPGTSGIGAMGKQPPPFGGPPVVQPGIVPKPQVKRPGNY